MDEEAEEMGTNLELFVQEDAAKLPGESQTEPLPSTPRSQPRISRWPCTPFQSQASWQARSFWSEADGPSGKQGRVAASPGNSAVNSSHHPDAVSPAKAPGVFQLQAQMCGDKLVLSLPIDSVLLATKRQRLSPHGQASSLKLASRLNGDLSEGEAEGNKDYRSPQLQPVVLLDGQVVPNWLASQSTRKQAVDCHSQKKAVTLQSHSEMRDRRPVAPTCSTVGTGRKACISGTSSSRWGQQGKLKKTRFKKNVWKRTTDPPLHPECLKSNKPEGDLSMPLLSPESSFKNSSLWRRIRASFSLHKKKIVLSESESFSSVASTSFSSGRKPLSTLFTQKLSYSICPSSSMVLLSSMSSFSMSEVMLTDEEKVYRECQQEGPIPFEECFPPEKMQKCEKIGEGVFGEVFKTEGNRGLTALKIIPIEGSQRVNGEAQKTFSEILPEIIISKELSLLADEEVHQTSGFISLHSVHCVQGAYPEHLLTAWDEYDQQRHSENNRPDFFDNQQLFVVLEFEFGGTDLENMRKWRLSSVAVAKSILHQVTASLAVAEEALHFEHRDLHWGNVLVKKTDLKEVSFRLNGETHTLPTQGILVNIIDYTFSRLERDGLIVYCDLSTDEEVFQGKGDYQFDIYRQMRKENANRWADYFPHSNVLWLHYLANKLLKDVSYRKKKPTTSSLRQAQKQLKLFSEEVLSFRSATDLLNRSNFFQ